LLEQKLASETMELRFIESFSTILDNMQAILDCGEPFFRA
jgi:hypothetical protein